MIQQPVARIRLEEFKEISRAISAYEDLNLLINHFVERVCRSFEVKGCSIMLFDDREKQLFRVGSYGISEEYLRKGPLHVDDRKATFHNGEPLFIQNMQEDHRVQYPEDAAKEGIVSMLSVPIKTRRAVIGIIRIYNNKSWVLHEDDLDSFCVLADLLGTVIEASGLKNFFDHVKVALETLPARMLEGL
ncbi:GAF domain-containing protein [Candidatus Magnetomoraceae bacterium gMMP-15]